MNSNKISRRSAIKKMAAVAAGVAVADKIPALASELSPELPQDDPTVSTLQMEDLRMILRYLLSRWKTFLRFTGMMT